MLAKLDASPPWRDLPARPRLSDSGLIHWVSASRTTSSKQARAGDTLLRPLVGASEHLGDHQAHVAELETLGLAQVVVEVLGPFRLEGETCNVARDCGPDAVCQRDSQADHGRRVCRAKVGPADACTGWAMWPDGYYCNDDYDRKPVGVCEPMKLLDEQCSGDAPCAPEFYCSHAESVPHAGPGRWRAIRANALVTAPTDSFATKAQTRRCSVSSGSGPISAPRVDGALPRY